MPRALTAFSVKIASPGGTSIKGMIAREVIYDWNSFHSWDLRKVLLPLPAEDAPVGNSAVETDLLVAFFCASQGAPSDDSARATDLEIKNQLQAGRPVAVYFSEGRTDFDDADANEVRELEQFKSRYPAAAMIDSFKDEKELRAKFAQQIEAILRYHPHFQTNGEVSLPPEAVIPEPHPIAPVEYSKSAQALLINACDDPEAYLARMRDSRGLKIQVNGRQFVEPGNAESAATWESAFNELLQAGLIRDVGCNGQLFQISASGFKFLETLGKYPIGYIAELGGM